MFEKLYYGNTIIQWFLALSLMVASFLSGRATYWMASRWLRLLTLKTNIKLDDVLLESFKRPMSVIIVIMGLRISLGTLSMSETISELTNSGFHFSIALAAAWFIVRLYDALHEQYLIPWSAQTDTDFDDQLLPVVKLGVTFVGWSLGVVVGLNNAGYDVGAVLAGLGIGGLAFALAAQDTVSNILGGLVVLAQQPFRIGNRIEVAGIDGWVREIGLRSSVIESFEGNQFVVPNSIFTANPVNNIDARSAYYVQSTLRLRHDMSLADIKTALAILQKVAACHPLVQEQVWVSFDQISDYSFDVTLRYGIKAWQEDEQPVLHDWYQKLCVVKTQMNLEIMRQFEERSIKLALPIEMELPSPYHASEGLFG